jgi:hypothetical protein
VAGKVNVIGGSIVIYDAEQNPLASGTIAPVEKHIFGKTSCGSFPELPAHG